MPMREWLWHVTSVRDDHGQGKCRVALKHSWAYTGIPDKTVPCYRSVPRERAWIRAWCRDALCTAILSLFLILTIMVGRPYAQYSTHGNEPAVAPPTPGSNEPAPTPAALGPLETLPSPQEQLLAPVPQQFNWLEREAPLNPLLESLLSLQGPRGLTVT